MKKIWEKYKEVLILLVYGIFLALIFVSIIKPLFLQIKEKRNYAEEKAVEQDITQKKIQELPQLKEKMVVVKKEEAKLNVFFEQENALSLIEKLETLASETGNDIKIEIISENNSNTKDVTKKGRDDKSVNIITDLPGKEFLVMRLSLAGDFNSIIRFVRKIENFDYFSDIISIKISEKDKTGDSLKAIANTGILNTKIGNDEIADNQDVYKYETPLDGVLDIVFYWKK